MEQIRRGNELAFEVAFERHGMGILAFCRHMLGSREEAEDVVQHTFAAAYSDFQRASERSIALKAWLYAIARNRCISVLRARRELPAELQQLPTDGLSEQVERRAELRELLADVRELPEDQRAALLLSEAAGLSHAEVAQVLGCEVAAVKGHVFRARSGLIDRRAARDTPCDEIREQLATLRGGALRRNELRHHIRSCPGCSAYRDELRHQRKMLAVALPVVPTFGLKGSVLAAAGLGGGAVGGASAGAAALGSAALAKVALVGVLAGSSVLAGEVVIDKVVQPEPARVAPAPGAAGHEAGRPGSAAPSSALGEIRGAHGGRISTERSHGLRGAERRAARSRGNAYGRDGSGTNPAGGRRLGAPKKIEEAPAGPRGQARDHAAPSRGQSKSVVRQKPEPRPAPQGRAVPRANVPAATDPAVAVVVPDAAPVTDTTSAPGQQKKSK